MQAFYEDGTLRTVEPYKDGLREGETVLYWRNGKMKRRVHFVTGVRHGLDENWDEEGNLCDSAGYENGKPVGVHRRYSQGKLIEEIQY